MAPIISIVGKTNSGKTTLIERIIPEFKKRGYRVGTIKHASHDFEMDHQGKDTWRHSQAGADSIIILTSSNLALIRKINCEIPLDKLACFYLNDVDIIITE